MTVTETAAPPGESPSALRTRRGALTLALLLLVQFLDFLDVSIVNVALPSIKHDLHFSVQSLQWVVSGYVLTYGGLLLLAGRQQTSSAGGASSSAGSSFSRSLRSPVDLRRPRDCSSPPASHREPAQP